MSDGDGGSRRSPPIFWMVLATLAAGLVVAAARDRGAQVLQAWAGAMTLIAGLWCAASLGPRRRSRVTPLWRRRPAARPPLADHLQPLRTAVELGAISEFELHHRLRPALWEAAEPLLLLRRGVDLRSDPAAAEALLGADAWDVLQPNRPTPPERGTHSLDLARIKGVIEAVERL